MTAVAGAEPLSPPRTADLTGSRIGRFQICALLGAGGMGEVYQAEDTKLKRSVALKRVSARLGRNLRSRKRILKEAQRACALNSQYIASIYDVVEEDAEVFLVMEYVEGVTLRGCVRQVQSHRTSSSALRRSVQKGLRLPTRKESCTEISNLKTS
jgi:serine/threonine protein kinase